MFFTVDEQLLQKVLGEMLNSRLVDIKKRLDSLQNEIYQRFDTLDQLLTEIQQRFDPQFFEILQANVEQYHKVIEGLKGR